MKHIFIVGSDFQWEEEMLVREGENLGMHTEFLLLKDITFHLYKNTQVLYKGENIFLSLAEHTIFLIRRSRGEYYKMLAFLFFLEKHHLNFTDSIWSISTNLHKKLSLSLIESNILPHPPETTFIDPAYPDTLHRLILHFPLVIKPVMGRHGEGVEIIENKTELEHALTKAGKVLILQHYIPILSEYRIFIVKGQSLGVVMKIPQEGKMVANYAQGASFMPAELPISIVNEAIRISLEQKMDIAGVDIAQSRDGKFYLFEVNRCPEFRAFSKASGMNVAREILTRI